MPCAHNSAAARRLSSLEKSPFPLQKEKRAYKMPDMEFCSRTDRISTQHDRTGSSKTGRLPRKPLLKLLRQR